MRRLRMLRSALPAAALLWLAGFAPAAQATTYCVQDPTCVGTSANLHDALRAAAASTADDVVQIGPVTLQAGTYPADFTYSPGADGGNLTIQGAGAKKTIITGSDTYGTALTVGADTAGHAAHVQDLGFQVQRGQGYTRGLSISRGVVERVQATSPGTGGYPIGLRISNGTTVRRSVADVSLTGYSGIEITGDNTTPQSRVEDSTAVGRWAILVEAGPGLITRTRTRAAAEGIEACNTEADVDDTVIELVGNYASGLVAQAAERCGSADAAIRAKHVTIVGDSSAMLSGVGALQVFADPHNASLELRHSIIRNVTHTIAWRKVGTATATIGSTDADLSTSHQTGTPGTLTLLPGNIHVKPQFVDGASGDYRLRWNSPVIDKGPSEPFDTWESVLDLLSHPRVVDGNGDGTKKRDMGAFEYQRRKPHAKAAASPAKRKVGKAFTFSAVGSSDPDAGDKLHFSWRFDDGATARGKTVQHAFSSKGKHHGTVTVTDPTGRKAHATATVTVKAP